MEQSVIDKVRELILSYLNDRKLQLVELQFKKGRVKSFLKILIDKECGGITVDECARVNEEIGSLLDDSNLITQSYLLEISSPGIDRPLITQEDFKRNKGKTIKVEVLMPSAEKTQEFIGTIKEVENEVVIIEILNGESYKIPLNLVKKAKIKLKWQVNN